MSLLHQPLKARVVGILMKSISPTVALIEHVISDSALRSSVLPESIAYFSLLRKDHTVKSNVPCVFPNAIPPHHLFPYTHCFATTPKNSVFRPLRGVLARSKYFRLSKMFWNRHASFKVIEGQFPWLLRRQFFRINCTSTQNTI